MADFTDSGAKHRALLPWAWKYYDGVIATVALMLMVINSLVSVDVFSQATERAISVGIAAVTALTIWMRLRATQLGVVRVDATHLNGQPAEPEPDSKSGDTGP